MEAHNLHNETFVCLVETLLLRLLPIHSSILVQCLLLRMLPARLYHLSAPPQIDATEISTDHSDKFKGVELVKHILCGSCLMMMINSLFDLGFPQLIIILMLISDLTYKINCITVCLFPIRWFVGIHQTLITTCSCNRTCLKGRERVTG